VASLGIHYQVPILGPYASTGPFGPSGYLVGGEGDQPFLVSTQGMTHPRAGKGVVLPGDEIAF